MFIHLYNSFRLKKSKDNDENSTLPMVARHDHYSTESNHGHHYKPLETDHSYFVQQTTTQDTVIPIQRKLNSGRKNNFIDCINSILCY